MCLWYKLYSYRIIPYALIRSRSNFLHNKMFMFRYQHLLTLFSASISPIKSLGTCSQVKWTAVSCIHEQHCRHCDKSWYVDVQQWGCKGWVHTCEEERLVRMRQQVCSKEMFCTSIPLFNSSNSHIGWHCCIWHYWGICYQQEIYSVSMQTCGELSPLNNIFSSKLILVDGSHSQIHTLALVAFWFWIIVGHTVQRKYINLSRMKLIGNINPSTVNFTDLWSMQIANWSSCPIFTRLQSYQTGILKHQSLSLPPPVW